MLKRLIGILCGYWLAVSGGLAAMALNEWQVSQEISHSSDGMVAFGDLVLFVLVAGVLSLVPSWFVLRLALQTVPRFAMALLLLLAIAGPVSWLLVFSLAGSSDFAASPLAGADWLGLVVPFVAIPRIAAGPFVILIEGAVSG